MLILTLCALLIYLLTCSLTYLLNYLRQRGYVIPDLCVGLLAGLCKKLLADLAEIFSKVRLDLAELRADQTFVVIRISIWILDRSSYHWPIGQTSAEYSAATWRTQWKKIDLALASAFFPDMIFSERIGTFILASLRYRTFSNNGRARVSWPQD